MLDRKKMFILLLSLSFFGGTITTYADTDYTKVTTMDNKVSILAKEPAAIGENGTLASVILTEKEAGILTKDDRASNREIELTLEHPGYEFETDNIKIYPQKGYLGLKGIDADFDKRGGIVDKRTIIISLPQTYKISKPGELVIEGLKVEETNSHHSDDILLSIYHRRLGDAKIKVGEVTDYGVHFHSGKGMPATLIEGGKTTISFDLKEDIPESFTSGREIELTLDKGYFVPYENGTGEEIKAGDILLNGKSILSKVNLKPIHKDKLVVGFKFTLPNMSNTKMNNFSFKDVIIYAPIQETGEVTIQASGRGIGDVVVTKVASIKPRIATTIEPITLTLDKENQKGGKILIAETQKAMFEKGRLTLELEDAIGIEMAKKPLVKVIEGNVVVNNIRLDTNNKNRLSMDIIKKSTKPSIIEISEFVIDTDTTALDGTYELTIAGSSIMPSCKLKTIKEKDFIRLGTKKEEKRHTKDPKTVATFTIEDSIYYINDKEKQMDATPYIDNGRTMLPVRYVAEAVGIPSDAVVFKENKIQMKAGNKNIIIQEDKIKLKEGRAYVPVADVAKVLGVEVNWNKAKKVATFYIY